MSANYLLGLIGATVTLVTLFEMLRHRHLREKYAAIWILVALGTVVIALRPGVLSAVSDLVGVEVPANLLFFLASMLLLLVSIQHSYELSRLEERARTLAEDVALLWLELEKRSDGPRAVDPPAVPPQDQERRSADDVSREQP